eukprot:1150198-Pelagomonas_calceolata.AAC.3
MSENFRGGQLPYITGHALFRISVVDHPPKNDENRRTPDYFPGLKSSQNSPQLHPGARTPHHQTSPNSVQWVIGIGGLGDEKVRSTPWLIWQGAPNLRLPHSVALLNKATPGIGLDKIPDCDCVAAQILCNVPSAERYVTAFLPFLQFCYKSHQSYRGIAVLQCITPPVPRPQCHTPSVAVLQFITPPSAPQSRGHLKEITLA